MSDFGPPVRPVYRLYIDEVGHASLKIGLNEEERYLCLTGVACQLSHVQAAIQPQMEHLKRFFVRAAQAPSGWQDPDEQPAVAKLVVFHRKEMVTCAYPFQALAKPEIRAAFDLELLGCLTAWDYTVFSVVIDKEQLQAQYYYPMHPYHFALEILLERYVRWLERKASVGDVMAEGRGGNEDRLLKEHYRQLYENGTGYVGRDKLLARLTSRELKVKKKGENIAGLQLAEFLVRPCYYAALARRKGIALPANFGGQIEAIVEQSKYYRDERGTVVGYGRKWFP